jgi:serine protease Do
MRSAILLFRTPARAGILIAAFIAVLAAALAVSAPAPVGASNHIPSFADLAERLQPSVVNISTETIVEAKQRAFPSIPGNPGDPWNQFFRRFFEGSPFNQPRRQERSSLGSGFIIGEEGLIVTNNHVVAKATRINIIFQDRKKRRAKVVGRDARTDIALLKVDLKAGEKLPALKFGNSDKLRVGDWVMAIGNPFGLSHTVTVGIVSAKGRVIGAGPYDDFIQTDASINPGNSGGPLFNLRGEVIGINTAIFSRGGGNIGIGFAIPVNVAKSVIPQLRNGGVTRGFLGVTIQEVSEALAKNFALDKAKGALVSNVVKDGPADKGGLRRGDVIVEVNGKTVPNSRTLPRMVAKLPPGSRAELKIIRNGQTRKVTVTLGKLPESPVVASLPPQEMGKKLGIQVQDLTPESAQQLQSETGKGAVITNVAPGSPASRAGLRRGDVIIEANRKPVEKAADLGKILKFGKDAVNVFLIDRRGDVIYVPVEVTG